MNMLSRVVGSVVRQCCRREDLAVSSLRPLRGQWTAAALRSTDGVAARATLASPYSTSMARTSAGAAAAAATSAPLPPNLKLCDEEDELKPEVHLRELVFKEDRIKCVPVRALDDASDEAAVGEVVLDNRIWSLP